MRILHLDNELIVCIKPAGVLSTDEPGGLPELLRCELGKDADIRTVHRLDRVVSGLMVLARSADAAAELSRQIRDGAFEKEYLAVVHGQAEDAGELLDLMYRDKARKMSFVTDTPGKGVQEAALDYVTLARAEGLSLVRIRLRTGRTHQIRCQFASRGMPLAGERKYCSLGDGCKLALWSFRLAFRHPAGGEAMEFCETPPLDAPWALFGDAFTAAKLKN